MLTTIRRRPRPAVTPAAIYRPVVQLHSFQSVLVAFFLAMAGVGLAWRAHITPTRTRVVHVYRDVCVTYEPPTVRYIPWTYVVRGTITQAP